MTAPTQPMVEANKLSKTVRSPEGDLTILHEVDLSIDSGQSLAVVGASGSGKSTLLGLLAGLDTPSSGTVQLGGESLSQLDEDGRAAVRARCVGFVFQAFQLIPSLTALENAMLPLELAGATDARDRALDVLSRVGLADRVTHYPRQLSGGEQQRVALARAFASRPKVLFADEPTGNLDESTADRVLSMLVDLSKTTQTSLVIVTHDRRVAAQTEQLFELCHGQLTNFQ